MYIAPGQGELAPRGQTFDVNRNLSKNILKSDLIQMF